MECALIDGGGAGFEFGALLAPPVGEVVGE